MDHILQCDSTISTKFGHTPFKVAYGAPHWRGGRLDRIIMLGLNF